MDLPGDLLERSAKESARLLALYFLEDATEARLSPRSHQWRSLEFPFSWTVGSLKLSCSVMFLACIGPLERLGHGIRISRQVYYTV